MKKPITELRIIDLKWLDNEIEKASIAKEKNEGDTIVWQFWVGVLAQLLKTKDNLYSLEEVVSDAFKEGFDDGITASFGDPTEEGLSQISLNDLRTYLSQPIKLKAI